MDGLVDSRWDEFIAMLVRSGRYSSQTEVMDAALEALRENERKSTWLRAKVQASIAGGGEYTGEEIDAHLDEVTAALAAREVRA